MRAIKELEETRPLLERARQGIEFFGLSESVRDRFYRIKQSHGLERFAEFAALLCLLKRSEDYRLLSSEQTVGFGPAEAHSAINRIVEYVNESYAEPMSVAEVAARVNMSESSFSRYFSKATDSSFTAFVNRVRVHKACQLLMHSDQQISSICYAVGFNNLANFNRRFREVKGVTPREFRRLSMDRLGGDSKPGRQGQ
jgi:AraC-like DNA-binding protein